MAIILFNPKAKSSNIHHALKRFKASRKDFDDTYVDLTTVDDFNSFLNTKETLFLIGGDGTINHFYNQIMDLKNFGRTIMLEPAGTGNDYYRTLKVQKAPLTSIMQVSYHNQNRVFINGMGIGIDGYIGLRVNKHKKKTSLTYFIETIKALIHYKPSDCEICMDGNQFLFEKTYLVVASNGKYFGGGMKITPQASVEDDLLDVIVVHNISRLKILLIFLSIYIGKHLSFKKYVFNKKVSHLKVSYAKAQVMQTDGETFENVQSIETTSTHKKAAIRLKR